MKHSLKYILCFMLGAVSGVAASTYFLKNEHERILQEEVESLREFYKNKLNKNGVQTVVPMETELSEDDKKNPLIEKSTIARPTREEKKAYIDYTKPYSNEDVTEDDVGEPSDIDIDLEEVEQPKHDPEHPYIIKPEEFGDLEGYGAISLSYYADGILADENDEVVDSPEGTVGLDFQNHFGEYANDVVYIRNDAKWCDYEISKDLRTFESLDTSLVSKEDK